MATRFIPTCWICDKPITLENCKIDEYGKGVHAECYAAKVAHPNDKSEGEKGGRWQELCALAATEQDPQKLFILMQEIHHLLDERERRKHQGKPPADPVTD